MSTLDFLASDFENIALADLQVDVTITHYSQQQLDAVTGDYTNMTISASGKGIIDVITKKDISLFPDRLSLQDKRLYISANDFSFTIKKGDKIEIGTNTYTVLEITDLDDVLLLFIRKH